MTDTLFLTMKEPYFTQCKTGEKTVDYREYKPYWISRIEKNAHLLKKIEMRKGRRSNKGDPSNLIFPWKGYVIGMISHPIFNNGAPTKVFAIALMRE